MNATLFTIPATVSKNRAAAGKVCSKCGKYKALRFFYKNAQNEDGYRNDCKDCARTAQRAARDKMYYVQVETKQCAACGRVLPIKDFSRDNTKKDGHRSQCKQCDREMRSHNGRVKKLKQPQSQLEINKA